MPDMDSTALHDSEKVLRGPLVAQLGMRKAIIALGGVSLKTIL